MRIKKSIIAIWVAATFIACGTPSPTSDSEQETTVVEDEKEFITVNDFDSIGVFTVEVPQTGRYKLSVNASQPGIDSIWIEDYIGNKDGRQYNITGYINEPNAKQGSVDGSPLAEGEHTMKIHGKDLSNIESIELELLYPHQETDTVLTQSMEGENWVIKWADEFNGEGLADDSKWTYNVGNWGWGNNELQYYTDADSKNANQENGSLIIRANPMEGSDAWTSARLTTQGKVSFLYGKIEFRAKVPQGLGTWAAGWLLGDTYRDEISWPYCGEIDVLECVGYEIDSAGNGINHASCHTPAYYFKKGNHITGEIELDSMDTKYHTYAIEWYPDHIDAFLDGEKYYTYDKVADELEWPFAQPQNLIINLAVGGGWGGLKGVDTEMGTQEFVLDYIRVYEKQ